MLKTLLRSSLALVLLLGAPSFCFALGDTLTVAYPADAKTFDPHLTVDPASGNVMRQVYESLVRLDENGNVIPCLAEKWEPLEGGMGYIFHLRKGVKFHNGETLKADDVLFTLKRATSPIAVAVQPFSDVIDADKIEVIDDYTIKVPTKQPLGTAFLASLNHPWASILNRKAVETAGKDYEQHPVGTGKFKFVSRTKNDRVVLERFDGYHGEKAKIKNVIIRTVLEAPNRTIELESGAVDFVFEIPFMDVKRIEENKALRAVVRPAQITAVLCPDITRPPYNDIRVRQAISLAIDRKGIVKAVLRGYGAPANGPIPQIKYNKGKQTPAIEVNVKKAKELLAEAGFPNGFKTVMICPDRADRVAMMTIIQSNLKAIGIDMELKIYEFGAYPEIIRKPGHDTCIWYNFGGAPAPDPYFFLSPIYHTNVIGKMSTSFLSDPKVDALLDKGAALQDGPEREAVYGELWDKLNELLPSIPIVWPSRIYGTVASLRGIHFDGTGVTDYSNAYFEK